MNIGEEIQIGDICIDVLFGKDYYFKVQSHSKFDTFIFKPLLDLSNRLAGDLGSYEMNSAATYNLKKVPESQFKNLLKLLC